MEGQFTRRVQLRYSEDMDLAPYLEKYDYFPEVTDLLFKRLGPRIRERKAFTCADIALICLWKALLWQIDDKEKWERASFHADSNAKRVQRLTEQIFVTKHSSENEVEESAAITSLA